ncbi:MAG: hypothetical protein J5875_09995, partial [Paludibacteraceae bacterium]|nr:hypothetical protein [Paludibacteraceae bacterium]
ATLVYRNFLKDLSSREPPGTLPKGVGLYNPKADAKLDLFPELANYSGFYFQYFFVLADFQPLKKPIFLLPDTFVRPRIPDKRH